MRNSLSIQEAVIRAQSLGLTTTEQEITASLEQGHLPGAAINTAGEWEIPEADFERYISCLFVGKGFEARLQSKLVSSLSDLEREKNAAIDAAKKFLDSEKLKTPGWLYVLAIGVPAAVAIVIYFGTVSLSGFNSIRANVYGLGTKQSELEGEQDVIDINLDHLEKTSTAMYDEIQHITETVGALEEVDADQEKYISILQTTVTALAGIVPTVTLTPTPTNTPTPSPPPEKIVDDIIKNVFNSAASALQKFSTDESVIDRARRNPESLEGVLKSDLGDLYKDGGDHIIAEIVDILAYFQNINFEDDQPIWSVTTSLLPKNIDDPDTVIRLWMVSQLTFEGTLICPDEQPRTDIFNIEYEGTLRAELQTFYRGLEEQINELDIFQWVTESDPLINLCTTQLH